MDMFAGKNEMNSMVGINPLMRLDYPDPDVIRVGDTYYMVSTTMHFMPGCEILGSYNLKDWEHVSFVYDRLDSTPGQCLEDGAHIYGKGMWAATLRYHKGEFYVIFVANDTRTTYLYRATDIRGPWRKSTIEGFYHDCSLLFDDDDRVYLAYGNKEIHIQELKKDLTGPLEGGLHRIAVVDEGHPGLGYEGCHFYKIKGKYYMFFIHSLRECWRRVEACFVADSVDGEFKGGDVFNDDRGYCGQGVAQGGIVDTPEGEWFAVMFQDSGAVGRIPILVPVDFEGDLPMFGREGKVPEYFDTPDGRPGYEYTPLVSGDDFKMNKEKYRLQSDGTVVSEADRLYGTFGLKSCWQFNHEPVLELTEMDCEAGTWSVCTDRLCSSLTQAPNTITQRMIYPRGTYEVLVDGQGLQIGDYAGIAALQGAWGMIALTRKADGYYVVMQNAVPEADGFGYAYKVAEHACCLIQNQEGKVRLGIRADFTEMKDTAVFGYEEEGEWHVHGPEHHLKFGLDHFTGCRVALFVYSAKQPGGRVAFADFVYQIEA